MEYRLLGPIEVVHDGRPLDLGAPKQRAVLAALLLAGGRVMSTDRLVEVIWGDVPPPSAVASLQVYISNLRRVLRAAGPGAATLEHRHPGYVLRAASTALDVSTFLAGVEAAREASVAGRWEEARSASSTALAVWRGPALADLRDEEWVRTEAAGLEERRTECSDVLVTALLALRRPEEALTLTRQLVAAHAYRDRARCLHLMALHRAGRSAEALDGYRRYARLLDEEMGLEPGPELRALQAAILRQDPALDRWPATGSESVDMAPATASRETPADPGLVRPPPRAAPRPGLVGRQAEMAVIGRLVDEVLGGLPRWLVLTGPPGIGKTRLAEDAAALLSATSGRAAWARCPEEDGVPAWWPLRQAVRALGGDPDDVLVPPLGVDADAARFAVYERLLSFMQASAAGGPVLLVVDDAQWADATSLRALGYLAGALRDEPVGIVLTVRQGVERPELQTLLAALARQPGTAQLLVPPLDAVAVTALVRQIAGEDVPSADAQVLTQRTGGNPLFVGEYARLPAQERVGEAIPLAVRTVLGRRLAHLDPDTLTVLRTAAVAGDVLDLQLLAQVTDRPLDALADVLDQAAAQQVLTVTRDGAHYGFAHGLLREQVLAELPPLRRQRLNAHLARVLANRPLSSDQLIRRAQHLIAALPLAEPQEVIDACTLAAADAETNWDSDTAARWWGQALEAMDRLPPEHRDDERRDQILLARVDALARAGRGQTVLDVVDAGLVRAVREGRTATIGGLAAALLRSSGAWPWTAYGDDPGVLQARLANLGDAVVGDRPAHVRVLAARAVGSCYHPDGGVPETLSRRALDLAEELGDPDVLADAIVARVLTFVGVASHCAEAVRLVDRLVALPHAQHRVDEVLRHNVLSMALFTLGDVHGAAAHVRSGIAACDELRLPLIRVQLRWAEAILGQWRGDLALAEQLVARATELHRQTELYAFSVAHLAHASVLWDQGRLGERADVLRQVSEPLAWQAAAATESGRREKARSLLDEAVPVEEPLYWYSLGHQVLLAHAVADAGAVEHSSVLIERLTPYAQCIANIGQVGVLGPVALAVGRLHALAGDPVEARQLLEVAGELAARCGGVPSQLRVQLEMLLLQPPSAERAAALAAVRQRAERLGMRAVVAVADQHSTPG